MYGNFFIQNNSVSQKELKTKLLLQSTLGFQASRGVLQLHPEVIDLLIQEVNKSRKGTIHTTLRREDIEKYLNQTNQINSFLNSLVDFA